LPELFAAALLMVPTLPGIDKPGYDIISHVDEHSGAMRMQALLVTLGSLALVVVLEFARVFDAPWQARALAIAVALVDKLDLPWDTFRRRLMDEIATDPQRPYYESWSAALESMVVDLHLTTPAALDAAEPTERAPR